MLWHLIHIIDILLWLLLAASTLYILFFALISTLWKKRIDDFTLFLTDQKLAMRKKEYFTYLVLEKIFYSGRILVKNNDFLSFSSQRNITPSLPIGL